MLIIQPSPVPSPFQIMIHHSIIPMSSRSARLTSIVFWASVNAMTLLVLG
jgi:hypothetical protein